MDHVSANKSLTVTERENISGARVFDGEDQGKYSVNGRGFALYMDTLLTCFCFNLGAGNRYRMQQLQQQDWCEQQIKEKSQKKELEKTVNNLFDQQALYHNQILTETQSEHNKRRLENERDTQAINGMLMQEKRAADAAKHEEWANQDKVELEHWNNHDVLTENPATEVSMLAPHRVKPYHFKGFKHHPHQTEQVNLERSQQLKEQEMMKK